MSKRECRNCHRDIGSKPPHWRFCSWRCKDEFECAEIGVPPSGWSDDDLDFGQGWESDDF